MNDKKVVFIDNPTDIDAKLREDFFPEYDFLPIRAITVSIKDDISSAYKNNLEGITKTIKNVDYLASNGINLDKVPSELPVPVEKFTFENQATSNTLSKFMNADTCLTAILNSTNINNEQLALVRLAIIVYDPIGMRKNSNPENTDKAYDIILSENAKLRDKSILKIYINNGQYQKVDYSNLD